DEALRQFCGELARSPWIAFDTEFIAERTYRPALCLVQVATPGGLAIIDPLGIADMKPFWEVVAEPGHETIVHAGRVELEFCLHATGRRPTGLLDVQIAAGLVGIEYPAGYGTLVNKVLGESPKNAETRTDWRRRPLSDRQIQYALDDVRYLPSIRDRLRARLAELGRTAWLEEEICGWQSEVEQSISQERWRRVSGNSGLDRRSLAIVRELWRWRDAEAQRRDCPPRRVLRDDLIIELARRQSSEVKRIQAVRGMERGDLKRQLPRLAECIERALTLAERECPAPARRESTPRLSVLGQFLFSALGSICRQRELAPGLVGTPTDVRELIAFRTGERAKEPPLLARGWRAEIVGHVFDDLLAGKLSIRIADPTSEYPLVFEPFQQS
ncbi:MAG: ribonuclease D, partial [Pirellulales bacterium]|nr:ribonuclease D [Pirellulales bacterium]